MVDRLKLNEKPRIRCRHSGGAFEPESRCFAGLHRNQSTGPRLKACRGDVIGPPIRVENMKRANAPAALSGPRFSRPPALPEASDQRYWKDVLMHVAPAQPAPEASNPGAGVQNWTKLLKTSGFRLRPE